MNRLTKRIKQSEEQIKAGKCTKADTDMSEEDINEILSV